MIELADAMLRAWRAYSDETLQIFAETYAPHNTITPILRRLDSGDYKLDLVLRNNLTTPEHPLGLYHPHEDLHHIKKENIGLIEVMGLFILPGRLLKELVPIRAYLLGNGSIYAVEEMHRPWVHELEQKSFADVDAFLHEELAAKCARVLADAGVYKQTKEGREGLMRFIDAWKEEVRHGS